MRHPRRARGRGISLARNRHKTSLLVHVVRPFTSINNAHTSDSEAEVRPSGRCGVPVSARPEGSTGARTYHHIAGKWQASCLLSLRTVVRCSVVVTFWRTDLHRLIHQEAEDAEDGVDRCPSDDVALRNTLRLADTSHPERDVHSVEGARDRRRKHVLLRHIVSGEM